MNEGWNFVGCKIVVHLRVNVNVNVNVMLIEKYLFGCQILYFCKLFFTTFLCGTLLATIILVLMMRREYCSLPLIMKAIKNYICRNIDI